MFVNLRFLSRFDYIMRLAVGSNGVGSNGNSRVESRRPQKSLVASGVIYHKKRLVKVRENWSIHYVTWTEKKKFDYILANFITFYCMNIWVIAFLNAFYEKHFPLPHFLFFTTKYLHTRTRTRLIFTRETD